MPLEPYVNPDRIPPAGQYNWEPKNYNSSSRPNWRHITITRGRFRNDYYVSESKKTLTITDSVEESVGKKYLPINNTFRNRQEPTVYVDYNYSDEYFIEGENFYYQIQLPQSTRISAIKLTYRLHIDILNKNLVTKILDSNVDSKESDADKVRKYQSDPTGSIMDVDWTKYAFVKVTTHDNLNQEDEGTAQPPSSFSPELKTTGFFKESTEFNDSLNVTTIRFAPYKSPEEPDNFSSILRIKISNNSGIKFKLYINKLMIFNAVICNISDDLLPCRLLSYVVPIRIDTTPQALARNSTYPNNLSFPTFELKVFVADDVVNTRGFAHAINLRFLFGSFPQYNPGGSSIIEAINNASTPGFYVVIFAGITLGKETVIAYLSSEVVSGFAGRIIVVDTATIASSTDIISIEKVISSSEPNELDAWQEYLKFEIGNSNLIDNQIYPFVFYDEDSNSRTWYRVIQIDNTVGKNITGKPFQGDAYIENSVLSYDLSGTRGIPSTKILRYYGSSTSNILNAKPFALFELDSSEDKFGSTITFRSGIIKFHFQGRSLDPSFAVNNHIVVRMWFMPGNESLDIQNPHQYRTSESEIIIKEYSTSSGTANKLSIGTPNDLEDLIVSPPLSQDLVDFDVIRYTNGLLDSQNKSTVYRSIYSSDPTLKIAVGLYILSYPTSQLSESYILPNKPPSIEIVLDPANTRIETTIIKNAKDVLKPSRYFEFNSRTYLPEDTNLYLSNKLYNGDIFSGNFKEYNSSFSIPTSANNASYDNLLSFSSSETEDDKSFCIKFDDYSLENDKTKYNWADIVTQGTFYTESKINEGTWDVEIVFDVDEDTKRIPFSVRLLGFFIDFTGKINERLFASPFIDINFETVDIGEHSIKFSYKVNYPFFIGGQKSQFILRVVLYPYSSNTIRLRDDEQKAITNALKGKNQGGRIKKITINRTPNSILKTDVLDSEINNSKFYENLPLTPNTSLDSNDFWFVVDEEFTKVQILPPDKSVEMYGSLYSPTWFLDSIFPKGVECVVKKKGLLNQTAYAGSAIMFRTVKAPEEFEREEEKISANRKKPSNKSAKPTGYEIVANSKKTDRPVTISSVSSSVNQYTLDSPLNTSTGYVVAGFSNQENFDNKILTSSVGQNPSIINYDNSAVIIMNYGKTSSNTVVGLSSNSNAFTNSWNNLNSLDKKAKNFNSVDFQISRYLNFVTACNNQYNDSIYICGLISAGALGSAIAIKKVDPKSPNFSIQQNFENSKINVTSGYTYILDGGADVSRNTLVYDDKESLIISNYLTGRAVVDTHNGICVTSKGNIYLSYSHVGDENKLKGLILENKSDIRPTVFTLIDMSLYSTVPASDKQFLNIFGSNLFYYELTDNIFGAFWCAGKIFVYELKNLFVSSSSMPNQIVLAAGNRNINDDISNKAHKYLRNLKNKNMLIINDDYIENDIPFQSPGFFVDDGINNLGGLFIYYRLISGELIARKISPGGFVGPITKISD